MERGWCEDELRKTRHAEAERGAELDGVHRCGHAFSACQVPPSTLALIPSLRTQTSPPFAVDDIHT